MGVFDQERRITLWIPATLRIFPGALPPPSLRPRCWGWTYIWSCRRRFLPQPFSPRKTARSSAGRSERGGWEKTQINGNKQTKRTSTHTCAESSLLNFTEQTPSSLFWELKKKKVGDVTIQAMKEKRMGLLTSKSMTLETSPSFSHSPRISSFRSMRSPGSFCSQ